jgi:hypothetical protein
MHTPIHPNLVAAAACALVISACGSSSPSSTSGPSQAGTQPADAQAQQPMLSFTNCMRSHGVPNFQDPAVGANKAELAPSTPHSPAFLSAYAGCARLLPGGGPNDGTRQSPARSAALLAFAGCMREHGFSRFPDPSSGQITHEMLAAAGIDLHQPAVVPAADACVGVTHGFITKAIVARFVAGR